MRPRRRFVCLLALLLLSLSLSPAACASDSPEEQVDEDLGLIDGKTDTTALRVVSVSLSGGATKYYRIRATSFHAVLQQTTAVDAKLTAQHYDLHAESAPARNPTLDARGDETLRNWTLKVYNLGTSTLTAQLTVSPLDTSGDDGLPKLDGPVQSSNDWCTYGDTIPYVRDVRWDEPLVAAALRAMGPGWHSTIAYSEWRVPYALENEREGTDAERRAKTARNFVRVLCGEHRDYPDMLRRKLEAIGTAQHYAGPEEMATVDTGDNLFAQLTYPAYEKLVRTMGAVHRYRQAHQPGDRDGYHYGFGEDGHGSNRVDHSVPPWTHCEMKFMFERYMTADAPTWPDAATYVREYDEYKSSCSSGDFEWSYNFRGHVVFQPIWLESNGFMMNSRRARGAEVSRDDRSYYLRPFASRYARARQALGAYLLYPDADHPEMIRASEDGGGPIMYVTDQDTDGNGIADYRLFDEDGCGDMGVSQPIPSQNCNMVSWEKAWHWDQTTGAAEAWSPEWIRLPDMGFNQTFATFEERMARMNAALDRHTNWGPTGYYMLEASDEADTSPRFFGAYSPFVAASYDVSASDFFVRRDYPSTDSFEVGHAKWLFVMRFRTSEYYDEEAIREGRPIDFNRSYFNETSLSNDFYNERALDHFGFIPAEEAYAQVYLVYGDRGEEPPELVDIGPP